MEDRVQACLRISGTGGILSEEPYPAGDLPQKDLTEKGYLYNM